jgi:single-strand DNA-binding protein
MPEIRTIKDDKKVATFTLAVTRNYKNKNGDYETDFVPVIA